MFKQLVLPLAAVALFVGIVGTITQDSNKLSSFLLNTTPQSTSEKMVTINDKKIAVKLADNDEKRTKGLGGTKSLEDNTGMLFIFDDKNIKPTFWMKDMLINIDIVWINDNKIVQIDKSVKAPAPNTPNSKLPIYRPSSVIDYVLELPDGYTDKNNIKVGDGVTIP